MAIGRRLGFKSLRLASESINLADPSQARSLLGFVMRVAFSFEAVGAVLLGFVFVPQFGTQGIFIAVFTAISAFCNAGFDILGRVAPGSSLRLYAGNPFVLLVVMLLIISGGLGLSLIHIFFGQSICRVCTPIILGQILHVAFLHILEAHAGAFRTGQNTQVGKVAGELQVGERNILICAGFQRSAVVGEGVFFVSKAASGAGKLAFALRQRINLAPVSYTHLDVYKRQFPA